MVVKGHKIRYELVAHRHYCVCMCIWANHGPLRASQVTLVVKNPSANAGDIRDAGSIPGSEDALKKEMVTYSSILAWKIPWTKEPGIAKSNMTEATQHACRHCIKYSSTVSLSQAQDVQRQA